MGVGGVALADELPQPFLGDARGGFGRQADAAHQAQPVEQLADVVRLGRHRHGLEPGERGGRLRIGHQQPLELGELRVGDASEHRIRRALAGAGAPGDGGALDHRREPAG